MQFGRIWTMRGPNYWARAPVIEAELDTADQAHVHPDVLSPLAASLSLPLNASVADLVLQLTRYFQRRIGWNGHVSFVHATSKPGYVRLVFDYDEEPLAKACLDAAFLASQSLIRAAPFDVEACIPPLRDLAHEIRLGPSTQGIVVAALARGIPIRRLSSGSLVQLGWSKNLRRIWTAETDRTPILAETIAQDKELTRTLLYEAGVPVPWGRAVKDADDAWTAAEELGLPVVVKPQYGNQGRGVATNLMTKDQVLAAYDAARKESGYIMVETYVPGRDHRLLVVGGKLTAASLREPAHVIGDGVSTIEQLVAAVNTDPRRSDGHATPLSFIKIDAIAQGVLVEQSLTPASVPLAGVKVLIRRNANLSTGGTAADVTEQVHPEVAQAAIDAARAVGLDIAGVDIVAEDISRPLKEQRGAIVEVNAGPGLRMHLEPSSGQPRDVGRAIVDSLFAEGSDGRIPVIAVTGVNGKTTTTRLIAHLLRTAGKSVGMTCTDGIYLNGRRTETRDCSGPHSARAILMNPRVEVAVLETARGGILREGLGFDRCDVGIVTNLGSGDHFGLRGIETLEELARVKQVVIEAVAPGGWGVLNAGDPLVAPMAALCSGKVIFFARDEMNPVLSNHRDAGGAAVFMRGAKLLFAAGKNSRGPCRTAAPPLETEHLHEELIIDIAEAPFLHHGVGFQIENALVAIAAAWGLGVSFDLIRAGLRTFTGNVDECPARFNVLHVGSSTLIIDYAHNPSAMAALIDALAVFPHLHRTLVTSGTNRRDEEVIAMGEMIGNAFDRVLLYADWGRADRMDGELNTLLRQGLGQASRVRDVIEVATEREALTRGLADMKAGELIVVGVESIEESLQFLREATSAMSGASIGAP